ncbi:MAG: polyprenyl synthetase family protein [Candidatus Omnitrophota bacterium]
MKPGAYLKNKQRLIDDKLNALIPDAKSFPPLIYQAMRYSMADGKRIRPILCMACAKMCAASEKDSLLCACAIEMIHTYSLIHDDLPCMDNDDYRRGRPSCHKKFDEATAVLAGDALMTLAYNILAGATKGPGINNRLIKVLSEATGSKGMIGGQVVDIGCAHSPQPTPYHSLRSGTGQAAHRPMDLPTIEYINTHKTGALIAASCRLGAIIARASKRKEQAIFKFGEYIGFAFQVVDDMLDNEGMARVIGKKRSHVRAKDLIEKAKAQLSTFGKDKKPLLDLADFILERKQ